MIVSYKYPIFPSKITQWKLAENLDACRWLYNRLLQDLNVAKEKGIKLKPYDTQNLIPFLKPENPQLGKVYSKVLQMVNYTLWSNIKGLSGSKKRGLKIGHIRFKGPGWYNTLNYNQSGFKIDQDHGLLYLSKIGDMRIKLYRKIEGCIKSIIIKREGKRWFAIVQMDQKLQPLPKTEETIGLDVGLTSFVVDSEGNDIENPRCAEQSADKLASCKEDSQELRRVRIIVERSRIRLQSYIRESIARETISYINYLGCISIVSISFVLRILMSKV